VVSYTSIYNLWLKGVSHTEFLFSLGGMFSSKPAGTSENVQAEVAEYLQKNMTNQSILTVDQRDFRAIHPNHCAYFEILP
jgi:hypothetical protein